MVGSSILFYRIKMESENIGIDLHSKVLDPVADEIIRVFKILQNDDGSWGHMKIS